VGLPRYRRRRRQIWRCRLVVETLEDLEYAAKTLPGASEIHDLDDAPGGGKRVTFHDPVDGWPMHLIWGQKKVDQENTREFPSVDFNFPKGKPRPANKFQGFEKRPAPVHKLGHYGMVVTDFDKTYEFYTSRFNLIASDVRSASTQCANKTTAPPHTRGKEYNRFSTVSAAAPTLL